MSRTAQGAWAALAALAVISPLALHVGWRRRGRRWPEATGWARIPRAPEPRSRFDLGAAGTLGLHWLGHSGFLVEWQDTRLLLDPQLADRVTISPRLLERPASAAELGTIDAALVSHAHYDHLDEATLAAVPRLDALLVPRGAEPYVASLGRRVPRIEALAPGEGTTVGPFEIHAVPAVHHGNRRHPLPSRRRAIGWVIRRGDAALYFAGDTGWGEHFAVIGRRHRPDLAILPIGAFSPRWPVGRVHLSPEQAVRAARALEAPLVVPCHFGTFTLSLDREDEALPRFAAAAAAVGLDWSMPSLLGLRRPGAAA